MVWVIFSRFQRNFAVVFTIYLPMYLSTRPLITNLTCPGDSSLYVEWAQPDTFYHGVDKYNLFIR